LSNSGRQHNTGLRGLLLILLGVLFLLHRFHPEFGLGHLIRVYWPVLLILWGVAKLVEHLRGQREGGVRGPFLGGGEAALLILVIFVLIGFSILDVIHRRNPGLDTNFDLFSQKFSQSHVLPPTRIPPGAQLTVHTDLGNITVHAGQTDDVRVEVNESATGASESHARTRMNDAGVVLEKSGSGYLLHPVKQGDSHGRVSVDLDVELPKSVTLTASTSRGDISISGIAGPVTAVSQNGDVEIHDSTSDVSVELQKGDARVSDVAGNVRVIGKGSEIEISDVTGDATLEGDFFGPIRIRNVAKTTHCATPSSDISLVHLTGRLELDSGQIEISDVAGIASLVTHNKDIEVENVAGRLRITNTHGDIRIHFPAPPHEEINVSNDSGDVDLTLPAKSSFEISAVTRSGEVNNEFEDPSLKQANDSDSGRLIGRIGAHGPKITIVTSYGTIYLRRSS
jgi:DUF4097 and DUF4098 domain-containing protein YvlB